MSGYIGTIPKKIKRGWIGISGDETITNYIQTSDTEFSTNPIKEYYELIDSEYVKTPDFYQDVDTGEWEGSMMDHPGKTYYEFYPHHVLDNGEKRAIKRAWVGDENRVPNLVLGVETYYVEHGVLPCNADAAAIYDNKLHIIGGGTYSPKHYSWNGHLWIEESIPSQLECLDIVSFSGSLYYLGGNDPHAHVYQCFFWDGYSWEEGPPLPYDYRGGIAIVTNNGGNEKLHLFGSDSGIMRRYHYSYDGNSWTGDYWLPFYVSFGDATVCNGKLYILGASEEASGFLSKAYYSSDLDDPNSEWIEIADMPFEMTGGKAATINNKVYIFGGPGNRGQVHHYDENENEWIRDEDLPEGRIFLGGSAVVTTDSSGEQNAKLLFADGSKDVITTNFQKAFN